MSTTVHMHFAQMEVGISNAVQTDKNLPKDVACALWKSKTKISNHNLNNNSNNCCNVRKTYRANKSKKCDCSIRGQHSILMVGGGGGGYDLFLIVHV